uniref:Uncharacterized protein n=1 Tax=Oryza meridionalis TaxID=40149 RepID=A0A0E0C7Y6_9ORYZ
MTAKGMEKLNKERVRMEPINERLIFNMKREVVYEEIIHDIIASMGLNYRSMKNAISFASI